MTNLNEKIKQICSSVNNDRTRLMDIVTELQKKEGCVSSQAMDIIADTLHIHRVEVESVVSFYAFLSRKPQGKIVIRLCNDVVDKMYGADEIKKIFEKELGIASGETTRDGAISLEETPCIGMCDQAPAVLVNDTVFTSLTKTKAQEIVRALKQHGDPDKIKYQPGDGNNAHELVHSMVNNCIRKKGEVIFGEYQKESGLKKALSVSPDEVIKIIKEANLRGRGGAGFPTGMKWEFTKSAKGDKKAVICNADEGEPGTFKDRVLLTESYDLLFEGMTIGGYAIGAGTGIIYLRGEYAYLRVFLEKVLEERRKKGLLGNNILGKAGFNFDIRIQMGAGAYICGEETALISSCEGLRGDPKNRPPFPAQKGYLERPTTVNNVETFACVARILEKGAAWFMGTGSQGSAGTKLLSISGACKKPGVYEFPFGTPLKDILKEAGALDAQAVLVGGPSGQFVAPEDFGKAVSYEELATGGSIVVFGPKQNLLDIVNQYMDFFVEESCGFCTPCRVGNVLLKSRLKQIITGKGELADLNYLEDLGKTMKMTSRCGLGQTSPNPVLSTIKNFRRIYETVLARDTQGMQPAFDIQAALKEAEGITQRKSVIFNH